MAKKIKNIYKGLNENNEKNSFYLGCLHFLQH